MIETDRAYDAAKRTLEAAPPEVVGIVTGHMHFHDPATGLHHHELILELVLSPETAVRFSNGQRAKRFYCADWSHVETCAKAAFTRIFKERKRIQAIEQAIAFHGQGNPIEKGEFNDDHRQQARPKQRQPRTLEPTEHHGPGAR